MFENIVGLYQDKIYDITERQCVKLSITCKYSRLSPLCSGFLILGTIYWEIYWEIIKRTKNWAKYAMETKLYSHCIILKCSQARMLLFVRPHSPPHTRLTDILIYSLPQCLLLLHCAVTVLISRHHLIRLISALLRYMLPVSGLLLRWVLPMLVLSHFCCCTAVIPLDPNASILFGIVAHFMLHL